MTDEVFEPSEIILEIETSDDNEDDVFNGFGSGPVPIEKRDGDLASHPTMLQYRLRKKISDATVEAIQEYLDTFGSGRARLRTINDTVFLQPRTQSDVDLLCGEMDQFVTGWRTER
ncbi:hypothetical protein VSX64_23080 [Aurantimonas sp. C2-6-R+9]|uniref:hypothetical protein n=1 Tax=unclassified Aurantimonas TaxID=2638230 RepID=UPI002E1836F1|nr:MULTISPECIES: hypothetical protein [unclassified Aurantimonas]MEC5293447.1 hypothetical protein [Aurantimonas sp. C2-3-R2]MEC5383645.1 hypothetical protein [Aurantimonas sp. C2-6-R+9]MEC5414529.1 hypothetical protein [Aurantimonas sp. C2-4-R8]